MNDYAALEPHGPLIPLFDDVWMITGSVVMMPLMRIPRNMVVLRFGDALTLVSSVRLDDEGMRQLSALGRIENVVRIGTHGMDDAWYVREHGAALWAPPNTRHARGLTTARELRPGAAPHPQLDAFLFENTRAPEAALLHRRHRLLITCDSVQHWVDTAGCSPPAKLASHAIGFLKRPTQIGPPWRKRMTPDGGSLEPDFRRLVELEFDHLVGGHGAIRRDDARQRLRDTVDATFG
ncbi:MAG: hypothetical protein H6698_05335 [Myxococcales bacterium]|nr:hypothetical protein [Myxococcales bacterium]MCB9530212.1 hypothetical protein [Myxococcales bacterium]MCB9533725.1 hypothetical protein [Myxococcales bacterium]